MYYAFGLLLCSYLMSFHALPWASAHGEAIAFISVLVWGWREILSSVRIIYITNPIKILLVFGLLIGFQYFCGYIVFGGDALMLLLYVSLCIVILIVTQICEYDKFWPTCLAFTLLVAAVISTFIALAQALWIGLDSGWILPVNGFRRPSGNLGQPNNLGTLLIMGIASLIYINNQYKINRWTTMSLGAVLIMGIGIAESRTSLIGVSGLYVWWFYYYKRLQIRSGIWWGVLAMSMLALMVICWPPFVGKIHEPGSILGITQKNSINTTASARLDVWPQLIDALLIKPWFGWGLMNVSFAHNVVLHKYVVSEAFTYAHNIILDLALGLGIPIALAVLWMVGRWFRRNIKQADGDRSWYAIAILIPFLIHSMFEYPFSYAYFLVPAMLAVGMLSREDAFKNRISIRRDVVVCLLVIFSGLFVFLVREYFLIEEDFRYARYEALNVGATPGDYTRPKIIFLTQLESLVAATRMEARPEMSSEDIELLHKVALRYPFISTLNHYALALALNGDVEEASRQLKVMKVIYGNNEFLKIRNDWLGLGNKKYPQLKEVNIPEGW